jgi:FkbM family methyltransferase
MKRPFEETFSKWRYLRNHPAFRQAPAVTLGRLISWSIHCALGIPATVHLDPWKVRLFLPPHWRGGGTKGIFALRHLYERELGYLERLISPGMVVVDAGANCGIYTLAAAKLVGPAGRVLSFEPGSQAFSVLKKNVEINGFQNVRAYRSALCDKNGKARLYHSEYGRTSFSLGHPKNGRVTFEEVTTRTLESVLEEEVTDQVGLIKLDVEGAEELVLRGVERILVRSHPKIIFEMNAQAAGRLDLHPSGAWDLLKRCGYRFFFLEDSGFPREIVLPPVGSHIVNLIAAHSLD